MVRWLPIHKFWKRSPSYLRAALATLPVLAVTCYLYLESKNSERLLLQAETARTADNAFLQFQGFMATRVDALNGTGNFVAASPGNSGSENFAPFVKRLLAEMREIESVSWLDPSGNAIQTVSSPYFKGPPTPVGSPAVRDALARAAVSRAPVATASFDLPAPGQVGTIVTVPVFHDGALGGCVAGTIRLTQGIRALYGQDVLDFWNLEIYDRGGRNVFRSLVPGVRAGKGPGFLVEERFIPVADRAWKLRLWPTPLMVATLRTAAPQRILTIGLLSTIILAIANFLLAQRQASLGRSLRQSERLAATVETTRRHLSDLVNGIEAVIWESDAGVARFTFVNDYARKLLGIDTERWVAEPAFWYENVHPDDRARAREHAQSARRPGQSQPVEYRMIDAAGQILWVREIITTIGADDHVEGLRGVVVDITARVQAEEALRQSQKLESLGVLAGGIAHDFNNLLTTILGNAELLTPYLNAVKSPGKHHLEKIERTTRQLADLTRQMLAYSGRGTFTVDQLDLNSLIVEMTDLLKVSTPKNVRVSYQFAPDLPLLEGDPVQVRQVLLNLLTNAAEAIGDQRPGSVIIRTDSCALDADTIENLYPGQGLEADDYVRLEVSDNGCGMSAGTITKIFDPFFTTKFAGRGLGLAALRGIVRGHRGGIRIFSQEGEGTVFTLIFPACGRPAAAGGPPPDEDHALVEIERTKVLLVDDEEGLRSLMAIALEHAGCTVFQASDGEEGMAQFRRHGDEIDVVVLDLTMPRMGGDEVFRRIRASRPDMHIILCSGYSEEDISRQFNGLGLSGFIEKPFTPSELIEKIGAVLSGSVPDKEAHTPEPSVARIVN